MDYTPYLSALESSPLLHGIPADALPGLLDGFGPSLRRYQKGALLQLAGDEVTQLGIVLAGAITATRHSPTGDDVVMAQMGSGGLFADVLSGGGIKSPVTITAAADCAILYLPYRALLSPSPTAGPAHWQLLQNLVEGISRKYFALDHRVELLSCKSLRGRLVLWLLAEREAAGADSFTSPLTQAQLAATLNCERSALSRELGRMRREGLLESWRGSYKLPDVERLKAHRPRPVD